MILVHKTTFPNFRFNEELKIKLPRGSTPLTSGWQIGAESPTLWFKRVQALPKPSTTWTIGFFFTGADIPVTLPTYLNSFERSDGLVIHTWLGEQPVEDYEKPEPIG